MAGSTGALEELDGWLADGRAETITEIDLSRSELRRFPEQLLRFRKLEVLSLEGNDIGELPEEIAQLGALRKLDVSRCGLASLPDGLAALGRLEELRVAGLGAPFDDDPSDDEDDLPEAPPVSFPSVVLRLHGLRVLDLSFSPLADLPEEIATLEALEELRLDAALGRASRLPDLRRLPRLRALYLDGRTGHAGRPPPQAWLEDVWALEHLEILSIPRWGEETRYDRRKRREVVVRSALSALPDDAFEKMTSLRRLDLSFNEIETLPKSFYALQQLEEVTLVLTNLDRPTVERLRDTLRNVRLDLRRVQTRFDLDDENYEAVTALVKKGARKLASDPGRALPIFEQAIALCGPKACYSPHDHLQALTGSVDALSRIVIHGDERADVVKKLRRYAEQALAMCAPPGTVKHLTDEAVLEEEATRVCGNALAWHLMEDGQGDGDLDRALTVVNRALAFARAPEHDFLRDTQARILLKLGREDDAFATVAEVLDRDPYFEDLQDIADDPAFLAWRAR